MKYKGITIKPRMLPGILWRILWWPFVLAAAFLLCAIIVISHGPESAEDLWRDIF